MRTAGIARLNAAVRQARDGETTPQPLTQHEIAALVGVKQPNVSEWLSGRKRPGYRSRVQLFDQFGIPMGDWDKPATTAATSSDAPVSGVRQTAAAMAQLAAASHNTPDGTGR